MKGKKTIFFLILILTSNISLAFSVPNEGYGEDSQALGQFVDSYTSLDNVSVIVDVVRNSTYDAMELNYTALSTTIFGNPYLREHDIYAGKTPGAVFSIGGNDYVSITSGNTPQGYGYVYFHVDRSWMDGKYLRWRWRGYYSGGSPRSVCIMYGRDFELDRTNDAHFPEGPVLGEQLEYFPIPAFQGWSAWRTEDYQFNNVSTGNYANMSILFAMIDAWSGNNIVLWLDWVEINTGAGGTGNLVTINFNNSTPVIMEQLGTQDDYGYVNDTVLPYIAGGYMAEGYFTSTNYLSDPLANGSALIHMENTTIPSGTGITIEFSDDNSTWILNDWAPLFGGFESIDLRDLNYSTGYYTRKNLTSTGADTPRVYQSRLITTIGNKTTDISVLNVTGEWVSYNLSSILNITGILDAGNLASTLDIDSNEYNISEVVGNPGFLVGFNWTDIDDTARCLWLTMYVLYDGNLAHDVQIELYNHTSLSWVELGVIDDDVAYEWHNVTVYDLRIPNDFVNATGAVFGRLNHNEAGNINHDLSIEYLKLHAFLPSGVSVTGGINSATIIMLIFLCALAITLLWRYG